MQTAPVVDWPSRSEDDDKGDEGGDDVVKGDDEVKGDGEAEGDDTVEEGEGETVALLESAARRGKWKTAA